MLSDLVVLLVLGAAIAVAISVFQRLGEIACLSVRGGKVLVVRGAAPGGFVRDVADVMERSRVSRATIRVVKGESGARIDASGLSEGDAQRVRNVLGTYPMRALREAPRLSHRNVGQVLGIAWLAWFFSNRA